MHPIAYNDEIYGGSDTTTESSVPTFPTQKARKQAKRQKRSVPLKEHIKETAPESITEIKQESDDDLIVTECYLPKVHKEIKVETDALKKKEISTTSARRTIQLKKTLRAMKQPVLPDVRQHTVPVSLPKPSTVRKPGVVFLLPKPSTVGRAISIKPETGEPSSMDIKFVNITEDSTFRRPHANVPVHSVTTKPIHKFFPPTQINVSGNVEKQTTIQGNVENLTIQQVSPQEVQSKIDTIVPESSAPELQVYIPASTALTQSQSVLHYRQRQRLQDKKIVRVKRSVDTKAIAPPVPATKQIDGYYYCDKCNKRFKDKVYFRTHLKRLCEALEQPEAIKCPKCDKLFRHYKSFKQHKQVHDHIKRYKCRKCGEYFLMQWQLEQHRKQC